MFQAFILIYLQSSIISYIIMPFYTYKTSYLNINISDYYSIQSFIRNDIYSYLTIGSPPQKIVAKINFNEYSFNIYNNQCDIPSEYNSLNKNSTTRINKGYILTDVYVDTYQIEDVFFFPFDSGKSLKLNYIYASMDNNVFERNIEKKKYTCANIGLKLSVDYAGTLDLNFLRELKSLDVIENYVFYLYYNSKKEEGNLIIGKFPHEIEKDTYNSLQYREVYAINNKFVLSWMFRFDKIIMEFKDNKNNFDVTYNLTNNLEAEIDYNLNIIYGSFEFMELIEKHYFNKNVKDGICKKMHISNNNLFYYECEPSLNLKAFPEIYFLHKTLSSKFILTYEDVFLFENNKYIFLIFFDADENKNVWKLGKPFLKKYLFTFDLDKKTIGYYCNKKDVANDLKEDKKINIKYTVIKLIFLSIIAFVLCYVITKFYYRQKKQSSSDKKLTELIYLNEEINK